LLVCTEANFGGNCEEVLYNNNVCTNVPVGFKNKITSVAPKKTAQCALYKGAGCTGNFITVVDPGFSNLKEQSFNDRITSFTC
ncbi:hypothetical protein L218DRAFT_837811, partial [Marasmius fiardii PR-910]